MPAPCAVRTETLEGSIDAVGDLTKHIWEVEHVWRATLDVSRRIRIGVHLEREGWRSVRSGRSRVDWARRASLGGGWMMVRVHRFIPYGGSQCSFVLGCLGPELIWATERNSKSETAGALSTEWRGSTARGPATELTGSAYLHVLRRATSDFGRRKRMCSFRPPLRSLAKNKGGFHTLDYGNDITTP